MKNIVLIGLSGCGKTALGRAAAERLGLGFFDMDSEIERREGAAITEIFAQHGEGYFRRLEARAAGDAALCKGTVISTGGGAVLRKGNMETLRENGFVIFIDRPPGMIVEDVAWESRPLLAGGAERVFGMARERRGLYLEYADAALANGAGYDEALEGLIALIRSEYPGSGYAVIGDPIAHSLSPGIHNAVFRHSARSGGTEAASVAAAADGTGTADRAGTEAAASAAGAFAAGRGPEGMPPAVCGGTPQYYRIHVLAGRLGSFAAEARRSGLKGFNVTIPHKQGIIEYLDDVDVEARLCGAVNTVAAIGGRLVGYNTDMGGLLLALESRGWGYAGRRVAIIGAGGAAAGIALKAAMEGAESICVLGRRLDAAAALVRRAAAGAQAADVGGPAPASACPSATPASAMQALALTDEGLREAAAYADIVINATPIGMKGFGEGFASLGFLEAMPPGGLVCDLVYSPAETALLREAARLGLEAMNGMGMLICQALLADEIFLGRRLDKAGLFEKLSKEGEWRQI
ncbi:MAG: hypothetical protein LBH39_03355 [Clostridiales Family XIII bacterium]|jgi:shikimate dehydrogenase|nr:hypothetical protein [Clostridiales Family XIII bacterium]